MHIRLHQASTTADASRLLPGKAPVCEPCMDIVLHVNNTLLAGAPHGPLGGSERQEDSLTSETL